MPEAATSYKEWERDSGVAYNGGSLYPTLVGKSWNQLPEAVRNAHCQGSSLRATGVFAISRGTNLISRLICCVLRMPSSADDVATELVMTTNEEREHWARTFGKHRLATVQLPGAGRLLIERFSFIQFSFSLHARADGLYFEQRKAAFQIGPLRLPIPRFCAPVVSASEHAAGGSATQVIVKVVLPWIGSLIEYSGNLGQPERHS